MLGYQPIYGLQILFGSSPSRGIHFPGEHPKPAIKIAPAITPAMEIVGQIAPVISPEITQNLAPEGFRRHQVQ